MAKKIQINRASRDELAELPGIRTSTADTLIKLREERGGFKSVGELEDVPGIGVQTLESIRPHIAVSKNGGSATRKAAETVSKTVEAGSQAATTNGEATADKAAEAIQMQADTVRETAQVQPVFATASTRDAR